MISDSMSPVAVGMNVGVTIGVCEAAFSYKHWKLKAKKESIRK
jgi:hypothetical protein